MAIGRGRRRESYGEFWPAYVDVLSTLLMVLMLIFRPKGILGTREG